jgi:hypothetical protein
MHRLLMRAALAGLAGGLAGAAGLWLAAGARPGFVFEMDRPVPPAIADGFYASERDGAETWVWVAPRARLTLADVDRRVPWQCTIRFRGGRPDAEPQPLVRLSIDGASRTTRQSSNDFQEIVAIAPALGDRRGLLLDIASTETFRPPADPRPLGVLVDRLACTPGGPVRPPGSAIGLAAFAGGLVGLAIALAGAPWRLAVGGAVAVALAQALPLTTGPALITAYPVRAVWLAAGIGAVLVAVARSLTWLGRRPLTEPAHVVLAGSAAAAYLKLLGLLHPSKPIVDALYHAHRLEWVLDGRLYFTQTMPNGVEFPYAVALYLFAAPWTLLTNDLVTLLRVVVVGAEAVAGGLLYVMVSRVRGDRLTGVLAVVLFHAVPVAYPVLGNANLTNAFGQSAALAAVAVAVAWPPPGRRGAAMVTVTALAAVALLSHVSTFGLTIATMTSLGLAWWAFGDRRLRPAAVSVLICVLVAALAAVALYWAHFGDTYRTLARVRAETSASAPSAPGAPLGTRSVPARVGDALRLGTHELGWPILLLAAVGAWRSFATARRDRVTLAVVAWMAAYVVFLAVGTMAPVSGSYERYAAEFIGRVDLAVYPAVVLLGAAGAAWLWRINRTGRLVALAALAMVAAGAAEQWSIWTA